MACKPGSVSWRVKTRQPMTIHLGRPLLNASCNQPGRRSENRPDSENTVCHPYLVLLPVGFTVPTLLPAWRCALTTPFHPYLHRSAGGLLSVALSLGSPPPGVTRHRVSVEPGLSSPRLVSRAGARPSGRLAPLDVVGSSSASTGYPSVSRLCPQAAASSGHSA